MTRALGCIAGLLLLSGCAEVAAGLEGGTEKARTAKDLEARVLIDSTCAMGIGAWNRLKNPNEQVGAMLLCGGQSNELLTIRAGAVEFEP